MRELKLHQNFILKLPQTTTLSLFLSLLLVAAAAAASATASSANDSQIQCSKKCIALNCDNVGIKYGKYCGVGYSGCPGENPCDDVDACCQIHDDCVDKRGMTNIKCHEKFKRCIKKAQKSGKAGFSKDCPYDVVVPTMVQGMDVAIMMSQFVTPKLEL